METQLPKDLPSFFRLDGVEEEKFGRFLVDMRKKHISSSQDTTKLAANLHKDLLHNYLEKNQISDAIFQLREASYNTFLKEEIVFNGLVLEEISNKFQMPRETIKNLSDKLFDLRIDKKDIFCKHIIKTFGIYAGKISPYIYALCLSNTQSRRSRAGKTFEDIIYYMYDYFGYSFDSQKKIGKRTFSELGLGKIVDSVLPGINEFQKRRGKTVIGTMKTTLRERWQEVVEEVARSNIPSIHLLTVDDNISSNKMQQMSQHNIVLVVLSEVKKQEHLVNERSVIDFETYFLEELPEIFNFWK